TILPRRGNTQLGDASGGIARTRRDGAVGGGRALRSESRDSADRHHCSMELRGLLWSLVTAHAPPLGPLWSGCAGRCAHWPTGERPDVVGLSGWLRPAGGGAAVPPSSIAIRVVDDRSALGLHLACRWGHRMAGRLLVRARTLRMVGVGVPCGTADLVYPAAV